MWSLLALLVSIPAAGQQHRHFQKEPFVTDTPMVHDPVMAFEDSTYYIFATGMGVQQMTSADRKNWTVLSEPVMSVIPQWTRDSVPGFRSHVWAPDVINYHGKWWLAYSCSTFGRNGSAIGLLSKRSLAFPTWDDEGCIVTSREGRDNWNAIDPNFVIDDNDNPWLVWGSFWDGIQQVRLDTTMHIAQGEQPRTIARRYNLTSPDGKKPFLPILIPPRIPHPTLRDLMRSKLHLSSNTTIIITFLYPGTTAVKVLKATTVWPLVAARLSMAPILIQTALICVTVVASSSSKATKRISRPQAIVQPITWMAKISLSATVTALPTTVPPFLSSALLHGRQMDGPS